MRQSGSLNNFGPIGPGNCASMMQFSLDPPRNVAGIEGFLVVGDGARAEKSVMPWLEGQFENVSSPEQLMLLQAKC